TLLHVRDYSGDDARARAATTVPADGAGAYNFCSKGCGKEDRGEEDNQEAGAQRPVRQGSGREAPGPPVAAWKGVARDSSSECGAARRWDSLFATTTNRRNTRRRASPRVRTASTGRTSRSHTRSTARSRASLCLTTSRASAATRTACSAGALVHPASAMASERRPAPARSTTWRSI